MKDILFTVLICVALVCGVYFISEHTGLEERLSVHLAGVMVGLAPIIFTTFERRSERRSHGGEVPLKRLVGFRIGHSRLILLGSLVGLAVINFFNAFGGVVAGAGGVMLEDLVFVMAAVTIFVAVPVMFLIGRWAGRRGPPHAYLSLIAIALILQILERSVQYFLITEEDFLVVFGEPKSVEFLVITGAIGAAVFSVLMLLGFWLGRRQSATAYLGYLLKRVDKETRQTILDLAYDEAVQATQRPPRQPHGTPAEAYPRG
ncbi:MAG: hypothetical protein AAGI70_07915 [Pseudomonadota bacterium]